MTQEERDFADRVFNGTIDFDRVTLTNMSHDGRAFTIPSVDDSILVNLDIAYEHPVTYPSATVRDYRQPGSVFIHELAHAWQITNNSFVGVICGMSSNYNYQDGPSDEARIRNRISWENRPWGEFNNEQQAHIVDDWYGAHVARNPDGSFAFDPQGLPVTDLNTGLVATDDPAPHTTSDPAFHFITDNIRRARI
jgi:hypothetical protein